MTNSRRALIIGVTGQDGSYLARLLLEKGYSVWGTTRDIDGTELWRLDVLGIRDRVALRPFSTVDSGEFLRLLSEVEPQEIYNLSGQTSVGLSFDQPLVAFESITISTMRILDAIRTARMETKYFNACSSECYGSVEPGQACDESSPFQPVSPYGVAKAAAYWACRNYREAYDLFSVSGILFNHESPLRPRRFVTSRIVRGAIEIKRGEKSELVLGNLDVFRDWGYAPEYVDAMWRMLQQETPKDYVIATGRSYSLRSFVSKVFSKLALDWRQYVNEDPERYRALDIYYSAGDPSLAREELGWTARTDLDTLIELMIDAELSGNICAQ